MIDPCDEINPYSRDGTRWLFYVEMTDLLVVDGKSADVYADLDRYEAVIRRGLSREEFMRAAMRLREAYANVGVGFGAITHTNPMEGETLPCPVCLRGTYKTGRRLKGHISQKHGVEPVGLVTEVERQATKYAARP
jgi:hypothetical protein